LARKYQRIKILFIERLVVIASEKVITENVIKKYWEDRECEPEPTITEDTSQLSEKQQLMLALTECNSNITHAAKLLGMDRSTLYRKLKTYKIEIKKTY
jgi:transcriptional regulator of acetoin/glycerol metabolism